MHVLINDFIGGVLDRGMPLYVRNLIDGMREEGFRVSVVRAPRFCRKLPRSLFYMFAVLIEQTALPLIRLLLAADVTLYPYNSAAIVDLFTRRARIVVHDLEQLNRRISPSKAYYLACYRVIKRLDRPVFTVSELSRQRLIASGRFGRGSITILPNTFYAFERLLRAQSHKHEPKTSICSAPVQPQTRTSNRSPRNICRRRSPSVIASRFSVSTRRRMRRDWRRSAASWSWASYAFADS